MLLCIFINGRDLTLFCYFIILRGANVNCDTNQLELAFFLQFEKEKQHDIRSFFSPGASKEKKRRRIEDEETSPSVSSEAIATPSGSVNSEKREEKPSPDLDFSPQLKRLRTPQPSPSPRSRFGGKRRSTAGGVGSGSPGALVSFMAPRKLSEPNPSTETWSCGACTYSNSGLLPYCEMCEFPRPSPVLSSGRIKKQIIWSIYPHSVRVSHYLFV